MNASLLFQEKVFHLLGLVAHNASVNGEPGSQSLLHLGLLLWRQLAAFSCLSPDGGRGIPMCQRINTFRGQALKVLI